MSRQLLLFPRIALILLALCFVPSVQADPILSATFGNTTSGPTFNRPGPADPKLEASGGYTPTVLTGVETHYSLIAFTVSDNATYRFYDLAPYDNYLLLYHDSFDPASPLTNVLIGRSDIDTDKASFELMLTPGVNYFAVVTGAGPADFGEFRLEVLGTYGSVNFNAPATPTPEPATLLLLGSGLVGAGAAARRRRAGRQTD